MLTTTKTGREKREKLEFRLSADAKRLLKCAASAQGRTVSEFVLNSALDRAAETLPDRTRFELDARQWAAFQRALDAPVRPGPRLRTLLTAPSVFDR